MKEAPVAELRRSQWAMQEEVFAIAKAPRRVVVSRVAGRSTVFDVAIRPAESALAIVFGISARPGGLI